jgi:hypothetical protein
MCSLALVFPQVEYTYALLRGLAVSEILFSGPASPSTGCQLLVPYLCKAVLACGWYLCG